MEELKQRNKNSNNLLAHHYNIMHGRGEKLEGGATAIIK